MLETFPQPKLEELSSYYESSDYISHTDSKRTLFEKAYHLVKGNALNNKVNLLGSKYDGNSKHKSTKKNVLDIICIPYQLERIPEWIIPLIDIDLIVDKLMKPGQFILNAIGVSTPDDYVTNVVDRKIINQILI